MKKALLITTSCVLAMASSAHAGFQFTAPIEQKPQVSIAPVQGGLLPTPDQMQMPAVPAAPVVSAPMQVAPTPQIPSAPQQPTGIMSLPQPVSAPVPSAPVQNGYDMAVGFGSDLPLVTALRQIIPSDYSYVLDKNIAVGQTVSWNGGQEWPVVLENTLAQVGMTSQINDTVVNIAPNQPQIVQNVVPLPEIVQETPVVEAPQPLIQMSEPVKPVEVTPQVNAPKSIIPNTLNVVEVAEKKKVDLPPVEPVASQWMAQSGQSLQSTLEAWSNLAGVDLFWSSDYDYPLSSDVSVEGEFADAVEMLLAGFSQAKPKPMGRLHPNLPNGPAVLIVETQQDTK